jgi:hypothetical protein
MRMVPKVNGAEIQALLPERLVEEVMVINYARQG